MVSLLPMNMPTCLIAKKQVQHIQIPNSSHPPQRPIARRAHTVSPINMSSASKIANSKRQAMATKPKLQKAPDGCLITCVTTVCRKQELAPCNETLSSAVQVSYYTPVFFEGRQAQKAPIQALKGVQYRVLNNCFQMPCLCRSQNRSTSPGHQQLAIDCA